MGWAARAWRANNGKRGVDVGVLTAMGWDNVIAEITLVEEAEVEGFIGQVRAAFTRAQAFEQPMHEEMPGPYDDGWR